MTEFVPFDEFAREFQLLDFGPLTVPRNLREAELENLREAGILQGQQAFLGRVAGAWLFVVMEEFRQMRKLPGSPPGTQFPVTFRQLSDLALRVLSTPREGSFREQMGPLEKSFARMLGQPVGGATPDLLGATKSAKRGEASPAETRMLFQFLQRVEEAWLRNDWPIPNLQQEENVPNEANREGVAALAAVIRALEEQIRRGQIPALPPPGLGPGGGQPGLGGPGGGLRLPPPRV